MTNTKSLQAQPTTETELFTDKVDFLLHLADTNLILAQRNAEWCGHGPVLEQDIAITNISLDLLGQARHFYQYAAELINAHNKSIQGSRSIDASETTEDSLAYSRTEREFKSLLITELPKIDWAHTVLRQLFYGIYQFLLYGQLQNSKDAQLAAIAEKSIKEVAYHIKWSSEWVIRLGDGTAESHHRMLKAMGSYWPYTGEFFMPAKYESEAVVGMNISSLEQPWIDQVKTVLDEATLWLPAFENDAAVYMHSGGKNGIHTEHLGFILAEMQYLQRTYPGAAW